MSYSPVYTSELRVEQFLQLDIDEDTHPSSTELNGWIEEIEADMLAQNLGTQTTTALTQFNVLPTDAISKGTIRWMEEGLPESEVGRIVVPPYTPIVSVSSGTMSRNTASINATPAWEVLTEGPGANSHFIILNDGSIGYAFYFYDNIPEAGYRKLRATWTYGYNINTAILREYATLKVSKKVLISRLMSGSPVGLTQYRGPDLQSYVNTNIEMQLSWIDTRVKEIEDSHFPNEIPVAVMK